MQRAGGESPSWAQCEEGAYTASPEPAKLCIILATSPGRKPERDWKWTEQEGDFTHSKCPTTSVTSVHQGCWASCITDVGHHASRMLGITHQGCWASRIKDVGHHASRMLGITHQGCWASRIEDVGHHASRMLGITHQGCWASGMKKEWPM